MLNQICRSLNQISIPGDMETDVVTHNGLQPKGEEDENFTQMNCDLKWTTALSRNKYKRLGI